MKTIVDAKQTAFFTQNGYIEFEIPHPFCLNSMERDQWRKDPKLQDFLLKKIGPIALILTGKKQLRLACDQFISAENRPSKACLLKEMFSIQGFALAVGISEDPISPQDRSPLGILPTPSTSKNLLFFRPEIILDWPHVLSDVYLAIYALPNAVYIQNSKDPHNSFLKQFGYNFGDVLKSESHPQIYI